MSYGPFPKNRLLTAILILLLHLPLIYHASTLYARLAPGQGVTDLDPLSALTLLVLVILPYALLATLGVAWNPRRGRLNEAVD